MRASSPESGPEPAHRYGSYSAWTYARRETSPVDMVWRSRIDGSTQAKHILLPFVEPSLILRCKLGQDGEVTDYDFRISRACPDGGEYVPAAHEEQFAVRLVPECAGLLGFDPLVSADVAMDSLPPAMMQRLEPARRLADAGHFEQAWRSMAAELAACDSGDEHRAPAAAMSLLRRGAGMLAPAQLAENLDVSARHLRRTFSDLFGASPRAIARRLRLTAALIAGEQARDAEWAGIAAEYGYSDQPHLIRECRAILGKTPARLVDERRKMAVSFNP